MAHGMHWSADLYLPGAHDVEDDESHVAEPTVVDDAQSRQTDWPARSLNLPVGHRVHEDWPTSELYAPAGQLHAPGRHHERVSKP